MNGESPCKTCHRKDEDKKVCSKICARLDAWRDEDPMWVELEIPNEEETAKAGGGQQEADQKTCKHEGCDGPVRCRGFCLMHYDLWRQGGLPEHPPFERIRPRKGKGTAPKKTKKAPREKTTQNATSVRPRAATNPYPSQIINIDLTDYPDMHDLVIQTAARCLVSPQHVIISLVGEAVAARPSRSVEAPK